MHEPLSTGLPFALALGAGVLAQVVARHLRMPSIVLLLGVGVLLGPDGLDWIRPRELGSGLLDIVGLAVAVILFEGSLNLELSRLRRQGRAIQLLITVGALITAAGATLAARWIMDWSWQLAILFGSLVIVTGPTVIRPLLRNVPLRPRLATVLEAEGILIDPVGAIVASVVLQISLSPSVEVASGLSGLFLRLGFGAGAGLLFGFALGQLLRWRRAIPEGFENIVTLGSVLVLFEGCEAILSESGILAVTAAGVVVGNIEKKVSQELREFEEHLTIMLIGVLFVLLAADVRVADVVSLGVPGLVCVGALVLLVRPANVWASTWGSDLSVRERLFLSWVAPRGIVAAAIASLFAAFLDAEGVAGGGELRALVFLTIAVTVIVGGGTSGWVARWLRVVAPGRETVVILGAEELGFAVGELASRNGDRVLFIDANPGHCRAAESRGFPVVFGNALAERTLRRARLEQAQSVLGLTANDEVNLLFAREARDDFGVPETYVAINRGVAALETRMLEKQDSRVAFDGPKDVERWNVRFRHGIARIETYCFSAPEGVEEPENGDGAEGQRSNSSLDPFIVLSLTRGDQVELFHSESEPRDGDRASVAIHLPEADQAREALLALGWRPEAELPAGD
ncbi:MAG: cation:proton antiporter [Proteobacteria bacterium]|nr:cation:proton antiporter [Pseudomonadota bacterium]